MKFSSLDWCVCDHVDKGEETFVAQGSSKVSYEPALDPTRPTAKAGDSLPEKARTQELVKDFAKSAIRGCPCEVIDPETGECFSAAYFIDPQLRRLTLKRSETPETTFRELDMPQIKDVLDADAANSLLPEAVLSVAAREGVRDRLITLSFPEGTPSAFIIEGSGVDRDRFIMCLKVLRLYAQTHGSDA
mmetsp:Transcript_71218/g.128230  ORF Transcript_71218/g.128230 Transcript_71218/m.128230 type:complete len:189 (+) Transcript_71218:67-633(+)